MIITGSLVSMSSYRESMSYTHSESAEAILTSDEAASITYSKESNYNATTQFEKQVAIFEKQRSDKRDENLANTLKDLSRLEKQKKCSKKAATSDDEIIIEKILRLLEQLKNKNKKIKDQLKDVGKNRPGISDPFEGYQSVVSFSSLASQSVSAYSESLTVADGGWGFGAGGSNVSSDNSTAPSESPRMTTWQRVSVSSSYSIETESTSYSAKGLAQTADGREIEFNVEVGMSRAFMQSMDMIGSESIICTDPLVINVGDNVAEISDKKYYFDLDSDGEAEEMSFATGGSGFLALDKNNDGKINNGNELFGTKSGNGFADLAAYDEDGNGWIDEADSVFKKLKVFSKDADGSDKLISLKDANVGAIYLGNSSTEFSLKNMSDNSTNGIIRSTGIYLKETGGVGTIQHVDIAL